jgi:5-formyltetrahydrofolate cyclo-ligase
MGTREKAEKRRARALLTAARTGLDAEARQAAALGVAERLSALPLLAQARTVAAYAPLGSELDPRPALARLEARGVTILFPRSAPGRRRLAFCAAPPGGLVPGPLGALEPPADAPETPLADLDAVLLPGLGFTAAGVRLGRGGGYYDETLRLAPRAHRIALAFDLQLVDHLPSERHDLPMDAVVTEARALLFPRSHPT